MAKPRVRFDENDRPRGCSVTLPPALAVYVYREVLSGRFRDETEVVSHIVRLWADAMDARDKAINLKDLIQGFKEREAGGLTMHIMPRPHSAA